MQREVKVKGMGGPWGYRAGEARKAVVWALAGRQAVGLSGNLFL